MALFLGQKRAVEGRIVCKVLWLCGLDNMKNSRRDDPAGNRMKPPACATGLTTEIELTAEHAELEREGVFDHGFPGFHGWEKDFSRRERQERREESFFLFSALQSVRITHFQQDSPFADFPESQSQRNDCQRNKRKIFQGHSLDDISRFTLNSQFPLWLRFCRAVTLRETSLD
jgi:hypothetical protein